MYENDFLNDSLNDSSEIFNLYSSKKISDIYNSQLLKLIDNKNSIIDENKSNKQSKNISIDIKNNDCLSKVSGEKLTFEEETERNISKTNNSDVVKLSDCSLDDSVEIVDEVNRSGIRRSLRLKNKQKKYKSKICDSKTTSSSSTVAIPNLKKIKRKKGKQKCIQEITLNESNDDLDDDLNHEVSVKIIWKSVGIKKFKIRRFQKMSKIYQDLSKEENVSENQIFLTFKNIKINPNDTPSSLNLQIYDFLEGGILSKAANPESEKVTSKIQHNNDDTIMLKFQDCNKKIIKILLKKSDKMKIGMIKYSEQREICLENIKYFFDGELLNPCETPQTLGLDGDEIIDVKIAG